MEDYHPDPRAAEHLERARFLAVCDQFEQNLDRELNALRAENEMLKKHAVHIGAAATAVAAER